MSYDDAFIYAELAEHLRHAAAVLDGLSSSSAQKGARNEEVINKCFNPDIELSDK